MTRGAGSKVRVSLPVETYDETVLVGLKAQDEEGRRGDLSNLVYIYVESTTTTTVSTTPTSTSPTTAAAPRTFTAKTFWLVVGSLLLFLLLLLCLVATWCMCSRRRGTTGGEGWKEEGGNGWREDWRREGGGGEMVEVVERRAATRQEWEMRKGARSGWEVEERFEERQSPPRYENPPDILPNLNNDGLSRAVRLYYNRNIM